MRMSLGKNDVECYAMISCFYMSQYAQNVDYYCSTFVKDVLHSATVLSINHASTA